MKRNSDYLLTGLLLIGLANGACQPMAGGPPSPGAQPLTADPAPAPQEPTQEPVQEPGNGSGSYGALPTNPEFVDRIRQALLDAYYEPEPQGEVPEVHFGFNVARDQDAKPFDQELPSNWTVYHLNRNHGTDSIGQLSIGTDRRYRYGASSGTFLYGQPKHYYQDSSTYWRFEEPYQGYYIRRGPSVYEQNVIRIYSARNNRMVGFAIQE